MQVAVPNIPSSDMANSFPLSSRKVIIFTIVFAFSLVLATGEDHVFGRPVDRELLGLKEEKLSHFRFYWHDILSGNNPTSIRVMPSVKSSNTLFGSVSMIDNPITLGPEMSSKLVGRAQGFYMSASQQEVSLLMAMNFAFIEGKYNGSSITILGRNPVFNKVREMPVLGGSGLFRFAKGYAQASTHTYNITTGDAIVEYNVYVMHF